MPWTEAPQSVCYATDGCCLRDLENLIVLGPGSIEQAIAPMNGLPLINFEEESPRTSVCFVSLQWNCDEKKLKRFPGTYGEIHVYFTAPPNDVEFCAKLFKRGIFAEPQGIL